MDTKSEILRGLREQIKVIIGLSEEDFDCTCIHFTPDVHRWEKVLDEKSRSPFTADDSPEMVFLTMSSWKFFEINREIEKLGLSWLVVLWKLDPIFRGREFTPSRKGYISMQQLLRTVGRLL